MNKLFFYISMITLILAFGLIILISYWTLYPYKIAEIKSVNLVQKQYKLGHPLRYELDFCIYTKTPVTITKQLVNDIIFNFPSSRVMIETGCRKEVITSLIIPKHLPEGIYYLKVHVIHQVNPLRSINIEWQTPKFEIIK